MTVSVTARPEWASIGPANAINFIQVPHTNGKPTASVQLQNFAAPPQSTDVGLQLVPGHIMMASDITELGWTDTLYIRALWQPVEVLLETTA